jgi:hypothetical protein
MTFQQFQATRRHSDCLADDLDNYEIDDELTGFIYLDALHIKEVPDWNWLVRCEGGKYWLTLDEHWITDDLTDLELRLFTFADRQGYFTAIWDTPKVITLKTDTTLTPGEIRSLRDESHEARRRGSWSSKVDVLHPDNDDETED